VNLSQIKFTGLTLIAIKSEIGNSLSLKNILDPFEAQKVRKHFLNLLLFS